ncbi:MmpS family transport accessory protein [Mycobacterium decipiens]|uniref:Uncharacterized protein n=1 Tax=Mycobacterium decipiens TaxID=1430326 RepID=A0A1X2LXW6_9MYCO|nr:MmpS family transport accessory protein [Mycobacterium decipiens]OSC41934.1 hypothetical protein B8W66_07215 [Mycobacterium decipiens]
MTSPVNAEPTPRKQLRGPSILVAICIGFAATCGVITGGMAHATNDPPQVRYEVSGSSGIAEYLSYQTRGGQRQEANVTLPWSTQFTGYEGEVLVLSAQGDGTIACRILVDGDVVKDATAAGQPGRTVCSYTKTGLTRTPTSPTGAPPPR